MNSHDLAVIIYYHKFIRTNRKIFSKFNRTSEKRSFENQKDHLENKRKKKTKTWNITRTYELAQLWPSGTKQNRGGWRPNCAIVKLYANSQIPTQTIIAFRHTETKIERFNHMINYINRKKIITKHIWPTPKATLHFVLDLGNSSIVLLEIWNGWKMDASDLLQMELDDEERPATGRGSERSSSSSRRDAHL